MSSQDTNPMLYFGDDWSFDQITGLQAFWDSFPSFQDHNSTGPIVNRFPDLGMDQSYDQVEQVEDDQDVSHRLQRAYGYTSTDTSTPSYLDPALFPLTNPYAFGNMPPPSRTYPVPIRRNILPAPGPSTFVTPPVLLNQPPEEPSPLIASWEAVSTLPGSFGVCFLELLHSNDSGEILEPPIQWARFLMRVPGPDEMQIGRSHQAASDWVGMPAPGAEPPWPPACVAVNANRDVYGKVWPDGRAVFGCFFWLRKLGMEPAFHFYFATTHLGHTRPKMNNQRRGSSSISGSPTSPYLPSSSSRSRAVTAASTSSSSSLPRTIPASFNDENTTFEGAVKVRLDMHLMIHVVPVGQGFDRAEFVAEVWDEVQHSRSAFEGRSEEAGEGRRRGRRRGT